MARHVRRGVARAHLSITAGALGALAAIGFFKVAPEQVDADRTARGERPTIGGTVIRNGSVKLKDLGEDSITQLLYFRQQADRQFLEVEAAATKYLRVDAAAETSLKRSETAEKFVKVDALTSYLEVSDGDTKFLRANDTDARFLQLDVAASNARRNRYSTHGAPVPFSVVAYDEQLANRIREELRDEKFVEKKMFGGLAFLIGGNMAIAASGQGGIMVRVPEEEYEAALSEPGAGEFVMRGRAMRGWLRADPAEADVPSWVKRGVAVAKSLPPKGT